MPILQFLKSHPFPVEAHFDRVAALSFAFPESVLQPLLPAGLEMDTYDGLGFVTVAMVWTRNLRPGGFPESLGRDFFLAGYRIFARLRENPTRRMRGLHILKSETDKRFMVWSGNLMTGYHYQYVKVQLEESGENETRVVTTLPDGTPSLDITFDATTEDANLPEKSPFPDWQKARLFAGPMPFTFSAQPNGTFVVVEGNRQDWVPRPIRVKHWQVAMFDESPFRHTTPILANAFATENIPYRWQKGRIVVPENMA